ncbi:MAG: phosphate ABC transporter permease subunit PstC [Opitutales bacterium]|nr:phosphate ABC transporter permease subunit PstC [Opitutales bacterium]
MESNSNKESSIKDILSPSPKFWGIRTEQWIKVFFFGNAWMSILILFLIAVFLFREGASFFSLRNGSHQLYRRAGLEFVEEFKLTQEHFTSIYRYLNEVRTNQINILREKGMSFQEAQEKCVEIEDYAYSFYDLSVRLGELTSELSDFVTTFRDQFLSNENLRDYQQTLVEAGKVEEAEAVQIDPVDFELIRTLLIEQREVYNETTTALVEDISSFRKTFPELPSGETQTIHSRFIQETDAFIASIPEHAKRLQEWDPDKPIGWSSSFTSFLFGRNWVTNSFWQDWYGFLPLLTGSLLVSAIALTIAIPVGVFAAIYVNQVAPSREQKIVKPCIEFISAVPSVVLGFFGIAVLSELLKTISGWPGLDWLPFFPITERLNAFTAGCLLALMAIPTIFTLAEDALDMVPRAHIEASYSMGATRLQTIIHIVLPSALSGIISAILLGFGRVIGETMVVLLCAGNRIIIPDISEGLGVMVEPVHTMTGIIAQEMGEVERGSIHYRALFVLGMFLFVISLTINGIAQRIVKRVKTTNL